MTTNEHAVLGLTERTLKELRELRQLNIDSAKGLEECCALIKNDKLRFIFRDIAHERREQAQVLASQIEWNNATESETGSHVAALHRAWIRLREACSADKTATALAEATRGEAVIRDAYEAALDATVGSPIAKLIARQLEAIDQAASRLDEFKHSL